ncbi:efflux RND transporter periplasmic adaptor subunit [Altererythrobacter sp.]|uniref:efflux RND transporter periplasmic adaptor subunit n=1 Tax=Altererythrobacter sp. TaxID=1872480 RepID=UPI001B09905B|nr:efflux RND transporter periplasmic adaptor subunit [Altererythrobacter sp.]MBO6609982.1 efflux RND transporter periplasmic adaptor subunit [Altererythrobacter sp.]MBO6642188.1 efflux RND transporter periplasmic adaptor subunit [Altererythrobacter sp.]MBO6709304.1 efflux RND transporter periplasmic adaptor subunit [Altererythrobacter sp.]
MNYESNIRSETVDQIQSDYDLSGQTERPSRLKWVIGATVLISAILAAAYFYFSSGSSGAVGAGDDRSQAPSVTVIAPGRTEVAGSLVATGTLAARREMPVGVVGEGGRVVSVPVEQGQWVRAGQILASIDRSVQSQQARSSAAQIEVARADAELAQANLDRSLQLVERGFVSQADVDRLTATRDAAVARVSVAQAQYNELLARNARLNIVAPSDGLLLERNVEPGQTVSAGTGPLFRIAKGGELELNAQVGDGDLARLSVGRVAQVQPVGSDKSFEGQIWQIAPFIDERTRQGTVRIALPYSPELRPGGFATAQINSGVVNAPMLPESAILSDDEGSFVYVIDEEKKARRRGIEIGIVTDSGITVMSGLDGTEQVVLRAGGFLSDGETVSPKLQED